MKIFKPYDEFTRKEAKKFNRITSLVLFACSIVSYFILDIFFDSLSSALFSMLVFYWLIFKLPKLKD